MNYTDEDVKRAAGQAMRAGIEPGASQERERIIKLLEEKSVELQLKAIGSVHRSANDALTMAKGFEWAIALIKGEK